MDEQQLQEQIVQLVQAAMQGDQQANQQIQQIMQAAQQGDQQAMQIAQMIQQVAQAMQQQGVQAAKFGAKLNYIKQLRGQCPDGYEMQSYKVGGKVCKKCMKKKEQGGEMPQAQQGMSVREEFMKCGGKTKKMKKKEIGGSVKMDKCGGKSKMKKACGGASLLKHLSGGSMVNQNDSTKQKSLKWSSWDNVDGDGYESSKGKETVIWTPNVGYNYKGKTYSETQGRKMGFPVPPKTTLQKKANGGSFIPFPRKGQK